MTTYLVVFHTVTAGVDGPLLGSDEKDIVQLIYLIIDTVNNKVVDLQLTPVRPDGWHSDYQLSTSCREQYCITDDSLEKADTLHTVIQKFDQYAHSKLQLSAGSCVQLVTDGQLPLRQCLHPLSCQLLRRSERNSDTHKDCNDVGQLPEYYWAFHDLRKHFSSKYSVHDSATAQQLSAMLEYLSLEQDTSADLGLRIVHDMANIVQRMLQDGHQFSSPETIDQRLDTGICSREEKVDSSCVVRARGLPWQSGDQDIANFFRGLNIAKGGVALCLSAQGRRNGEALVRFVSAEHRDMALKRHKHHIASRYIEIYKASGGEFVSVAGGGNTEAQEFLKLGGQVIVRMRGLPYDCTAKQVVEFFSAPVVGVDGSDDGCAVVGDAVSEVMLAERGVLFVKKVDGRATGDAFVQFEDEAAAGPALSKHRRTIGSRYIELFRSTVAEVQQVLNRSMDPRSTFDHLTSVQAPLIAHLPQSLTAMLPHPAAPATHQPSAATVGQPLLSGTRRDCVRLRGLPFEAQVEHILQFLGELANLIKVQGVHMVINGQGQPSGEAFIQMVSDEAAFLVAKERDHRYMQFGKKQRYIEVFQCSGDEMNVMLNGAAAPTAVAAAGHQGLVLPAGTLTEQPSPHQVSPALAAAAAALRMRPSLAAGVSGASVVPMQLLPLSLSAGMRPAAAAGVPDPSLVPSSSLSSQLSLLATGAAPTAGLVPGALPLGYSWPSVWQQHQQRQRLLQQQQQQQHLMMLRYSAAAAAAASGQQLASLPATPFYGAAAAGGAGGMVSFSELADSSATGVGASDPTSANALAAAAYAHHMTVPSFTSSAGHVVHKSAAAAAAASDALQQHLRSSGQLQTGLMPVSYGTKRSWDQAFPVTSTSSTAAGSAGVSDLKRWAYPAAAAAAAAAAAQQLYGNTLQ